MIGCHLRLVVLLILCCVRPTALGSTHTATLHAAGDGEHVWFLVPSEQEIGQWDLCLGARRSGSLSYRVVRRLVERPVAIGAWSSTVWMLLPSSHVDAETWEVYQLRAVHQPSLGVDLVEPREGLGPLPPLTGFEAVDRLVGTSLGPVVIGSQDGARIASRLVAGRWEPLALPEHSEGDQVVGAIGCCGPGGLTIAMEIGGGILCWGRSDAEAWVERSVPMQGTAVDLLDVDGHPVLASIDHAGGISLHYVQDDQPVPLASLEPPGGSWSLTGVTGGVLLLSYDDGRFAAAVIDAPGGVVRPLEVEPPVSLVASSIWSIAVAVGLACMVVMIIVLARGGDLANSTIPEGYVPMQPMTRLLALAIDLIPGLIVFYLFLDGATRDLVRVPMMSLGTDEVASYAWMVLVTIVWCLCWEYATGASPGKWLCGGRVRSTTDSPPGVRQLLIRNLVKGLVLLVPPLAVLTLLHPNQQGLGDLLARTVVVRPVAGPSDRV